MKWRKAFKRLQHRRNGCEQARENFRKVNKKGDPEKALRMPGSMKK